MSLDAAAAAAWEPESTRVARDRPALPAIPAGFPDDLALFLDLDGTVLDLAPTPDAVVIAPEALAAIGVVAQRLDGALAIVTGRALGDVDRILSPLRLPAAALHGAELRRCGGGRVADAGVAPPDRLTAALGAFVDARPGLALENKGVSVAVHYRAAPEREGEVRARIGDLVAQLAPAHELQPGKMVVEVRPRGCDKGAALRRMMSEKPFAGRTPLMIGDDLTDEFAFEAANALGGASALVGRVARPSVATYGFESPDSVRRWLVALGAAA
ncbi:trehalose 6-phosphate phosphatase [Methylopila jiangsuensis]|uniref:Trehalose 6-phosphate phosphatase n=1 Tax=Methylopila jiangsuensis TaxID=586230 RepID=A0A9W6JET5_9HYPH|nr:trehalose-phosphatase [Methylopila jiangsuensis]MDR6285355.1 trehalose 6-phosphate phosphatase [Methylopila jiangsuensis]GLK75111.1 trehalose 6-phosphate phosphatase [Methylopila jiangsuensis]